MAEELLNGTEVGAFFEEVGSEGVAQGVRMHVRRQAAQDGDALDDASDAARGEASLTALLEAAQLQIEKESRGSAFAEASARLAASGLEVRRGLAASKPWRRRERVRGR